MNDDKLGVTIPKIFCRSCGSPLLQAADWNQELDGDWCVRLWCPECNFERVVLLDKPQVTYLSLAIEEGFARMLEAFSELDCLPIATH